MFIISLFYLLCQEKNHIFSSVFEKTKGHPYLFVTCAFSADQFRAGTGAQDIRVSDLPDRKANGYGNFPQVHSDQRPANVKTCMGADMLHGNGGLEMSPCRRCERSASLGIRHDANGIEPVLLGAGFQKDL